MENIEFLHKPTEEEPFAVIIKPRGIASAPLFEGDISAYTHAAKVFPELNSVKGKKECEHGLLFYLLQLPKAFMTTCKAFRKRGIS